MKFTIKFEKTDLKDLKKKYEYILNNQNKLQQSIIDELKRIGYEEIENSLGNSNYESSDPTVAFNEKDAIGIRGSQSLYDEYGTGTVGEENPHPNKDETTLELKGYNTGSTIRRNKSQDSTASTKGIPVNGLYWTYKIGGQKIYTQGRPAGMHVYKAKNRIKQEIKNVMKKKVGEFLSKA